MKKNNKSLTKKGVSPIIALSLIFVVAVTASLSFTGWFTDLSTGILTKSKAATTEYSKLIDLTYITQQPETLTLYYENKNTDFIFIESIKINDNYCSLVGSDILPEDSLTQIEVSGCEVNSINQANVVLFTNSEVIENSKLVDWIKLKYNYYK